MSQIKATSRRSGACYDMVKQWNKRRTALAQNIVQLVEFTSLLSLLAVRVVVEDASEE
jgi:hypothetical protein